MFDFTETEALEPNMGTLMPVGNHAARITESAEDESKNGNFGVALTFENSMGDIRAWLYLSRKSPAAQKFTQEQMMALAEATGCGDHLRAVKAIPSQEWSFFVAALKGKTCGIAVRDEKDDRPDEHGVHKTRRKVQAYCDPSEVGGGASDVPADTDGLNSNGGSPSGATDDDIPF